VSNCCHEHPNLGLQKYARDASFAVHVHPGVRWWKPGSSAAALVPAFNSDALMVLTILLCDAVATVAGGTSGKQQTCLIVIKKAQKWLPRLSCKQGE
jgi:hypothetical protein